MSALCQKTLECVVFYLMPNECRPLAYRVQGTLYIKPLHSKKDVRMLIAMMNFICNRVKDRTGILEPLTRLTKCNKRFAWGEEQETAFYAIKNGLAELVMLVNPRIDKSFHLCPHASDCQI